MSKESATIMLIKTIGYNCSKIERAEAGVPPYHLNKYKSKQVVGILLSKDKYKLNLLNDNDILFQLTAPDRRIVMKYSNDKKKNKYFAHHIMKCHWLKDDDIIENVKIKAQNRKYLNQNHPLVNDLRKKIYMFSQYENKYDITYVILSFEDRYITLLQSGSKWFEFRLKIKGTTEQDKRHLKALTAGVNVSKSQVKQSNRSKKKKFKKVYKSMDYVYEMQKNIHSLIVEKTQENPNYNPLTDPEITYYTNFLAQWKVSKLQLLNAKSLTLKKEDYNYRKYTHNLHHKSWEQLKSEYCPGEAASTS